MSFPINPSTCKTGEINRIRSKPPPLSGVEALGPPSPGFSGTPWGHEIGMFTKGPSFLMFLGPKKVDLGQLWLFQTVDG